MGEPFPVQLDIGTRQGREQQVTGLTLLAATI